MKLKFLNSILFVIFCFSFQQSFSWTPGKIPSRQELKAKLTPIQYNVTQESGTEPSFKNEYWNNHQDGLYVDVVSGEPLFSSKDKYESGTGWPSFSRPIDKNNIIEKEDKKLFSTRTEVRSKLGNSHLGHVFSDGPKPTGLRYCMNSAALRFIPKEKLKVEGYSEFAKEFESAASSSQTAVFAGGCFWCMQPPFDSLKKEGVIKTTVGYTGGQKDNPTYEETSSGSTGHREAVEVTFDPGKISYQKLLEVFWQNIDPLDESGQFCDKGEQYTSAIFYNGEAQKKAAEESLAQIMKSKSFAKVATKILPAKKFYSAEEYHQSYYSKNPVRYKFYRSHCGRDDRLKAVWGSAPKH